MPDTTIYCSTCGAANRSQASFCFSCGKALDRGTSSISVAPIGATGRLAQGQYLNGRYQILLSIAQGGMGAVYKAEDTLLGNRLVAIKEMGMVSLYPNEVTDAAEMFKQEALMLAKLHHPNLPSIYDHFSEAGRWYLVMSFIEGASLEHALEKTSSGKFPVSEVIKIGSELCSVLDYLHTQQPPIIFRDLKPSNIIRTSRGAIYLIDFGIARHFNPGKVKDTANYGTAGYAPPEQFGKAQTTPRSDIYSLGVTLHQLLTGRDPSITPFQFPTVSSLGVSLPVGLESLIMRMLDSDINKRPANMLEVKTELLRIDYSAPIASQTAKANERRVEDNPERVAGPGSTVQTYYPQSTLTPTQYAPSSPSLPSAQKKSGNTFLRVLGTILSIFVIALGCISFLSGGIQIIILNAKGYYYGNPSTGFVIGTPITLLGLYLYYKWVPAVVGKWIGGIVELVGMLILATGLVFANDPMQIATGIFFVVIGGLLLLLSWLRK
ncbi:serine/threonine protein kinase [Dictyobacter formicarum]|uniref:non-specific serine/threonine protein kinase n=1 Tax=Dictyobacter formicarum TaxID=2778368 RepID=A0ABQ3VRD1_9CHLR|nr:protein kinase [Dictyobacter formicarum]GHO87676.1 hypothetical protein KSZ_56820 [Dictyobacter formicarum]